MNVYTGWAKKKVYPTYFCLDQPVLLILFCELLMNANTIGKQVEVFFDSSQHRRA